jgi:hypothetical protein
MLIIEALINLGVLAGDWQAEHLMGRPSQDYKNCAVWPKRMSKSQHIRPCFYGEIVCSRGARVKIPAGAMLLEGLFP